MLSYPAILMTDIHYRIIYVNEYFVKKMGYTLPEIRGHKTFHLLASNADHSEVERIRSELILYQKVTAQLKLLTKDNRQWSCKFTIQKVTNLDELTEQMIFTEQPDTPKTYPPPVPVISTDKEKNTPSPLMCQVHQLLQQELLYLDAGCSSVQIAAKVHTHPSTLSKVIKKECGYGLPTLINVYRINHFKKLVISEAIKHQTIWALARESGFKNEATFHRQFMKLEGISPKVFIAISKVRI